MMAETNERFTQAAVWLQQQRQLAGLSAVQLSQKIKSSYSLMSLK
jgi:hypothetical protein